MPDTSKLPPTERYARLRLMGISCIEDIYFKERYERGEYGPPYYTVVPKLPGRLTKNADSKGNPSMGRKAE